MAYVPMSKIVANNPTPAPTSKYAEERINLSKYKDTTEEKLLTAEKEGNYSNVLDTEYDKIKADTDNDGKISKTEYNNYIVYKEELPIVPSRGNIQENHYNTHHYYHLDFSFYIVIGMICITAIIVKWIRRKPYQ